MTDANPSEAKPATIAEPAWCEELRRRYLRGESSQFVLFGNVHDVVLYDGKLYSVTELLAEVVFARTKDTILVYNVSTGVRFTKRKANLLGAEELIVQREPAKVLPLIERMLTTNDRLAAILEYADTIAPAGDTSFSTMDDRAATVTLHRWSLLRTLERSDSIIVLVVENLSDLNPKIVSNPRVATVRIPMPSKPERATIVAHADPCLSAADVERLSEITAGLKAIQLVSILTPSTPSTMGDADRTRYVLELLTKGASPSPAVLERAQKLAAITKGMSFEEIRRLIAPDGEAPSHDNDARAEVDRLVAARKREIIERECFGLIEFVEPQHGFDMVGGLEEVKRELSTVAKNMREGHRNRCPMGLLFTGPMGTGKTFVAEAFAKESKLTTIKLKNFRSKWVGATEGNLEKILHVIQAIGQIIVIIDEGDRAFGGSEGDGDGGTSSRVIGRIKEFMSDTENRGRVLFVLMTNRPDKLDVDIKRAGRLDRKIPFFYPQTPDEVDQIVRAQLRKAKVTHDGPIDSGILTGIVGYSNADIEAVVLLAADNANAAHNGDAGDSALTDEDLAAAVADYLPSRDIEMIEYMELLAVFEASNRRMLPSKYAELSVDELQTRLMRLKIECGNRR